MSSPILFLQFVVHFAGVTEGPGALPFILTPPNIGIFSDSNIGVFSDPGAILAFSAVHIGISSDSAGLYWHFR
jgi:16S rRNA C1402 (ribose-2'-O) methylase RsmI